MVYGDALCDVMGVKYKWKYDDLPIDLKNRRKYLFSELSLCQQNTIMFRQSIVNKIGLLDENLPGWTDDALVLSIALHYPAYSCHKYLCIVNKSSISMTSNKQNLYRGLRMLLRKYGKNIIKEAGLKRYILWKVRLLSSYCFFRSSVENNIYKKFSWECLHRTIRSHIISMFSNYFE